MNYWLCKSEPDVFSIDDLRAKKKTLWDGVRNYQARNYLREMAKGDLVLVYHSNSNPSGIVGIGEVSVVASLDPTQFDSKSEYYDPKSTKDNPRWFCPEIKFKQKFEALIPLSTLKTKPQLSQMKLLQKGSRLSVMPVSKVEFKAILTMAEDV